jgi:hypothetical protein
MIRQDANKVDNELSFISLEVERAHTGRLYKGARVIRTLSAGALQRTVFALPLHTAIKVGFETSFAAISNPEND